MSLTDAFSIGLALVVVGLALWTVAARDAFAAVVEGDRFIGLFHADPQLSDFPRSVPIA